MAKHFSISNHEVGEGYPAFIIAELSCNHQQNFDIAVKTIEAIKKAGADAVKIQTYTPDTMTIDADTKYFTIKQNTIWDGKTFHKLYQEAYTPWEWQPKLQKIAHKLGLAFFSSPFDISSVDFLAKMNVPVYKVASFEIRDIPLIRHIARKGKPIIISTGIAELADIKLALSTCYKEQNRQVALLKCTSAYPTPLDEVNLRTIPDMKKRFGTIVGLSDHTEGDIVPAAAVALGASIVEKHFILDRKLGGPDAAFSMEPAQFSTMVQRVRDTEKSLGKAQYVLGKQATKARLLGRSLFVVEDIQKGELLTEKNIRSIRPGFGLHPKYYDTVIGKKAVKHLRRGTPLKLSLFH